MRCRFKAGGGDFMSEVLDMLKGDYTKSIAQAKEEKEEESTRK